MKSADKIIRTQRLVPEVYSDESRDFQVFTRIMDCVFNNCQFDTTSMLYATDPRNIRSNLLSLLADKYGVSQVDAETLTDDEVRAILMILPELIKNKGSLYALNCLVNIYFKIYHIYGDFDIKVVNHSTIVQDITLADRTILLGLETLSRSTKMLDIISKYILPPGYAFYVYFYTKLTRDTRDLVENDQAELVFRSTNLNQQIDQEIPDFIFESETGIERIFSAVDASQLSSIQSLPDYSHFIGFTEELFFTDTSDNGFYKKYTNAEPYDKDKSYTHHDIAIHDGVKKIYVTDYPMGIQNLTSVPQDWVAEHSSWRDLVDGSTAIVNKSRQSLGNWDCQTGLPEVDPRQGSEAEYIYKKNDFFVLQNTTTEQTNYIPSGIKYTGSASTTVGSNVDNNDIYIFNGLNWEVFSKEIGFIYFFHNETWHELNYRGPVKDTESSPSNPNNYDYYCKIYHKVTPILYKNNQQTELADKGMVNYKNIPTEGAAEKDLVYNEYDDKYYAFLNKKWGFCNDGTSLVDEQMPSIGATEDNQVYWRHGGEYYVYYDNTWNLQTYPIFLVKMFQFKGDQI